MAYEPSKSVGTDKPLLPEDVNTTIAYIKNHAREKFGNSRFLYGGSVNHRTASLYNRQPNIDGIMIGRIWQDDEFEETLASLTDTL